jgi:hypothetical protein
MTRGVNISNRGSVVLVALSMVAVIAIGLATYLALAYRTLQLSNRSYQAGLTTQLAETGLERALQALNQNNWTNWNVATDVPHATRTITFAADKFGPTRVATSINLRVNQRNAKIWRASDSYTTNDTVWYRGLWYRCIANHANRLPPDPAYWVSAPGIWDAAVTYSPGDIVVRENLVYSCLAISTGDDPALAANSSFWSQVTVLAWNAGTAYTVNTVVRRNGALYRCLTAHTNQSPPNATYWVGAPMIYAEGVAALSDGTGVIVRTQLHAELSPVPLFPNAIAATNPTSPSVRLASTGQVGSYVPKPSLAELWTSGTAYRIGDTVYYAANGQMYRCISNHTSNMSGNTPNNTSRWTPLEVRHEVRAAYWNARTTYNVGDIVYLPLSGRHYRSIQAGTENRPDVHPDYWADMHWAGFADWSSTYAYRVGDLVYVPGTGAGEGRRYLCTSNNTNRYPPTNPTRWTVSDPGSPDWSAATTYASGDSVYLPADGRIYRSRAGGNLNRAPATSPDWWAVQWPGYDDWSSGTTYATGDLVYFTSNGLVYRSRQNGNTNRNPGTQTAWWTVAGPIFTTWSATTNYVVGDIAYNEANYTFYRCTTDHTNQKPPNAAYWSEQLHGYRATIAGPSITINNAVAVSGYLAAPTTTLAASTLVKGASSPGTPNADPQRISDSHHVPTLDLQPVSGATNLPWGSTILPDGPSSLGIPPNPGTASTPLVYNITGTRQGASTFAGLYLSDTDDVLTIRGPVVLNVSGIFYLNNGRIIIAPGGSLEVRFSGQLYIGNSTSTTIGGVATPTGGGIINETLDPRNLLITSTSTYNTSSYHYLWTRHPFIGLVYMPSAYLHVWNSGFNRHLYGAISARTVYFNHTAHLHYDASLRASAGWGSFVDDALMVSTWRELPAADRVAF